MGIAERFKNKLDIKDIFKNSNSAKYISKPEEMKSVSNENSDPLANLENNLIEKIRRTPYWSEYSQQKQENLISLYFKTKKNIYGISDNAITEFVKNIMVLSNNE